MNERMARMALAAVVDGGQAGIAREVEESGAEAVWRCLLARDPEGSVWGRQARLLDVDALVNQTTEIGARFVIPSDPEWPASLAPLANCATCTQAGGRGGVPLGLWVRGPASLGQLSAPVAIVGSRTSTSYGDRVTGDLAADLAERGHAIISGGAYGIDIAAHRGALAVGGTTAVVLACGVDLSYPRTHHSVFARILDTGLVVSEYPPGQTPVRQRFLVRNRLIAALSECVVVVEAAHRSGARNTAWWAGECGRSIAAVPGPVTSSTSASPHEMIRSGEATLVAKAADVAELVGPLGADPPADFDSRAREMDGWTPERVAVFEAMPARAVIDMGALAMRSGLGVGDCMAVLGELEMDGLIRKVPKGWQLERAPAQRLPLGKH